MFECGGSLASLAIELVSEIVRVDITLPFRTQLACIELLSVPLASKSSEVCSVFSNVSSGEHSIVGQRVVLTLHPTDAAQAGRGIRCYAAALTKSQPGTVSSQIRSRDPEEELD